MKQINLKVDGKNITVDSGKNILEAAQQAGIEIPTLCYHKKLLPYGACRLCMVEITSGNKSRVVASCAYPIEEGLEVNTKSPKVINIRKLMIELLLPLVPYNPLIKKLAEEYGIKKTRFKRKVDACILCGLCVRYSSEVKKHDSVGFVGRGVERHIAWVPKSADDKYESCPECSDICPTDVFRKKELSIKEELFASGHRLCAGCGAATSLRQIMLATEDPVVVSNATGCAYVATVTYPYTAWKCNYIHSAFENAAATISGIEAAYQSLKRQGKIKKTIKFIAIGGDGGTYDIGLQSLSGALERGHSFLYICYNNEAYMNTGIQRSGATPMGASTTTSPAGTASSGKNVYRKDLTAIIAAHNIPYVAQTTPAHWDDLITKVKKALAIDGPTFINILSPCHRGWRIEMKDSMKLARIAADTCYWPLYEVENGEWKLNYIPNKQKPITEWMKPQGRFKHLFQKPEYQPVIDKIQNGVNKEWAVLLKKCGK
ncbi:MAG: thiamine pyrophosphate-dependent enzyme [Planctomycetota bacterium]